MSLVALFNLFSNPFPYVKSENKLTNESFLQISAIASVSDVGNPPVYPFCFNLS